MFTKKAVLDVNRVNWWIIIVVGNIREERKMSLMSGHAMAR